MAIDPEKMRAFAGGTKPDRTGSKKPGAGKTKTEDVPDDDKSGGTGKFSGLIPVLEQHAGEIEDLALDLEANPSEILQGDEPDPETMERLREGHEGMDDELKDELAPLGDAQIEDCQRLASHMRDENMIDSEDEVAAWLWLTAKELHGAGEDMEEEEPSDEDFEGTEEDEEGGDDLEDME